LAAIPQDNMSDSGKSLLAQARKFDQRALGEIYDVYSDALYKYAMGKLGNPHLSEDFVAETFQRFLEALHKGGGPKEYIQAYLYRTLHNLIADYYRREPPPPLQLEENRLKDKGEEPDGYVTNKQRADRLRWALRQLTPGQQEVIILRYLQGLDHQEISRIMDKSIGAVKSQQHRGLASLERILLGGKEGNAGGQRWKY